jgi:glutamate-5-semialdehyde dehydrogenase
MNALAEMGQAAKEAANQMAKFSTQDKNAVLVALAGLLRHDQDAILQANQIDLNAATAAGMNEAMLDRLSLKGRLESMADDVLTVVKLPDPVGEVFHEKVLENGLKVRKQRTPIGVIGVIYEARPNVTIDVAALCIKSGNCAILRGGKEAIHSNRALVEVVSKALNQCGFPATAVQFVDDINRDRVMDLLHLHQYVDMIIPRGGNSLHQFCREHSTIPVITGGIGVCHLFVDETADVDAITSLIDNAKTQRPTVCNALDTLLVHPKIAEQLIPKVIQQLGSKGVRFTMPQELLDRHQGPHTRLAISEDWDTEWLGLTLGIKLVGSLDEAIAHIQKHSTGHSDGILTRNMDHAQRFVREIDSAAVYVNASTRFTDGSQLGLGAEVAISTQKLHARGPMGLEELTSYKWVIWGNNHSRQ